MYGLLLESLACYIKENYGEDKWEEIRRAAVRTMETLTSFLCGTMNISNYLNWIVLLVKNFM